MKNYVCFLIVLILSSCDAPVDQNTSFDYSIDQSIGCFCTFSGELVRLFVKADTIADAIILADNSRLAYERWSTYKTIKGLYNDISNIDTSVFDVVVTIDTVHNFPSLFYFNPKPMIHGDTVIRVYDAQMSYTTKNYNKLK